MMLSWALVFFVLAIVMAVLGFGGIFAEAAGAGFRLAFFVFLIGYLAALIVAITGPRRKASR